MKDEHSVVALADAGDPRHVGGKAATLSALLARGHRVPDGFVVPVAACAVVNGALPDALARSIAGAVRELGDGALAVRSSAVAEDGADASFAGQLYSALDVRGSEDVVASVMRCIQSAREASVATYRAVRAPADDGGVAVLVQRMVAADASGVAFTIDPSTGDPELTINATAGLGEALMAGTRSAEVWRERGGRMVPSGGASVLDEPSARAVASLARRVAREQGAPQDIEWAIADGEVFLLQARPVTAAPVRPDFDDPEGVWLKDEVHYPGGMSAFGASTYCPALGDAMAEAAQEFGLMIDGLAQHWRAGELYGRPIPLGGGKDRPAPPWWLVGVLSRVVPPMRRRMRAAQRALDSGLIEELPRRWDRSGRADFERRIRALAAVELEELDLPARLTHLERVLALLADGQREHFLLFIPWIVEMHAFARAARELLGWDDGRAMALLAGTSRTSTAPTRELDALARRICALGAEARDAVAAADDCRDTLQRFDASLAAELRRWFERWGLRASKYDTGAPTLGEQPGLLDGAVRHSIARAAQATDDDAAGGREERAPDGASELLARAYAQLSPRQRSRFDEALARARRVYPVREDNVLYTDNLICGLGRRAALAIGRALAARGQLERASDAAELTVDELRRAARDERCDVRTTALRRQRERAWVAAHPGPSRLGGTPHAPPDLRALPAAGRTINEALLWAMALEYPDADDSARQRASRRATEPGALLHGLGAWPGSYTGTVRVVRCEADLSRLRQGDVLVAPVTVPAWSVAFSKIGALVTDTGGTLSHAAIVAREYGLPTVLDTGEATRTLRDGELVVVDGARGTVTLAVQADEA